MKHEFPIKEPRTVEISMVSNDNDCESLYYSVIGKRIVGPGEFKTIDSNCRVKENNIIIDKNGQVGLRVWG